MQTVHTTIVYWLVAASVLTSVVASYTAYGFTERLAASTGRAYRLWLAGGAWTLGLGIWSMHYLGMLAVRLPMEVVYHLPTVALSLVLAVLASAVVLPILTKNDPTPFDSFGGSLMLGAGIGGMHYVGMHAMRCSAMHHYDAGMVALSVVVAVVFSWMAIEISITIRRRSDIREWLRVLGATVMGLGIAAMHYTAMAAVTFKSDNMRYSTVNTIHVSTVGVVVIVCTASVVLFGSLFMTILDRRGYDRIRVVLDQLSEERDRFSAAAESSMDAFYICSAIRDESGTITDFVFTYLNSNMESMVAISRDKLLGGKMSVQLSANLTGGLLDRYKLVVSTGKPLAHEFAVEDKELSGAWFRVQAVKVRDGVAVTMSNITERKQHEAQMLRLAQHDPLTGLFNRSMLHDRITGAVDRSDRYGGKAAIFLVDCDRFKQINDTFGHVAGDTVLVTVAHRLREIFRASDSVFRVGGDEFVVVIGELKHHSDAQTCGEKIVSAFQRPISVGGVPLSVTCSVGGVVYPDLKVPPDDLLLKADVALYIAKEQGKNQLHIYSKFSQSQSDCAEHLIAG